MLTSSLDTVKEAYSEALTEAQLDSMDGMMAKLPNVMFFVNLFWCWLFGTVLAAIFSRNIPPRNPFIDEQ